MGKIKHQNNMIYTSERHIPIGEAFLMEDGQLALRIKKPKSSEYDVITINDLIKFASQKAFVMV